MAVPAKVFKTTESVVVYCLLDGIHAVRTTRGDKVVWTFVSCDEVSCADIEVSENAPLSYDMWMLLDRGKFQMDPRKVQVTEEAKGYESRGR